MEAQVSKSSAHFNSLKLLHSQTTLMLHVYLKVDTAQRISVLAAAASSFSNKNSTTDDFLDTISYESEPSLLFQCDNSMNAGNSLLTSIFFRLLAHLPVIQMTAEGKETRLNTDQLSELESKYRHKKCNKERC